MLVLCYILVLLWLARRQREAGGSAADEQDQPAGLPHSSDGLQLTRVVQSEDRLEDECAEAHEEEEARQQIQERLPGGDWKARIGTAGTPLEQQRVSPIVELSMLLVHPFCLAPPAHHSPSNCPLLIDSRLQCLCAAQESVEQFEQQVIAFDKESKCVYQRISTCTTGVVHSAQCTPDFEQVRMAVCRTHLGQALWVVA